MLVRPAVCLRSTGTNALTSCSGLLLPVALATLRYSPQPNQPPYSSKLSTAITITNGGSCTGIRNYCGAIDCQRSVGTGARIGYGDARAANSFHLANRRPLAIH